MVSKPGEPLETRVDYTGLAASRALAQRIGRTRRQLTSVAPDSMDARERLAWAINLYNFRVIELVLANLFEKRTGREIASVRQLGSFREPFFERTGLRVGNRSYSLDAFERRFVFLGFDRESGAPPPPGLDPRAHFALVCAAVGCPPLQPRAFRAESLDAQLDAAARGALANPRHLRWDPQGGRLLVSELFNWYRPDFGKEGPLGFIKRYAPAAVVKGIEERGLQDARQVVTWDWALNRFVPGR